MKGSRSAQRRMYTQRDQKRRSCPTCAACIWTRALIHSRSHTHKHAGLCWCDKRWTFGRGCQDMGQTTPSHRMHCRWLAWVRPNNCVLWLWTLQAKPSFFSWTAQFRDFGLFDFLYNIVFETSGGQKNIQNVNFFSPNYWTASICTCRNYKYMIKGQFLKMSIFSYAEPKIYNSAALQYTKFTVLFLSIF